MARPHSPLYRRYLAIANQGDYVSFLPADFAAQEADPMARAHLERWVEHMEESAGALAIANDAWRRATICPATDSGAPTAGGVAP